MGEIPSAYSATKHDELGSITLTDVKARIKQMDAESIDRQVIYPTLFLAYPLTDDPRLGTAMCRSYNRWIADVCNQQPDRLQWVCTVNLGDVNDAVAEVRRGHREGALGCMILGTVGEQTLDDSRLDPFYAALCEENMPLAVHVGWSSPALGSLYANVYDSLILPFTMTLLTGFVHVVGSGVLDRFPTLRVAFLEAGCQWIPFILDRMEHYYEVGVGRGRWPVRAKQRPLDYVRGGNVYFGFEVDDRLLPQAIEQVGDGQFLYASDIPHGDREWDSVAELERRTDVAAESKQKLLITNVERFYGV
jgi:predicted TIM-barrel fold metal-dependent hydrolase